MQPAALLTAVPPHAMATHAARCAALPATLCHGVPSPYASPATHPPHALLQEITRFLRNPGKPAVLAMSRPDPKKNLTTLVRCAGLCCAVLCCVLLCCVG